MKRYKQAFEERSPTNKLNPFTMIRHCLYLADRATFSKALSNRPGRPSMRGWARTCRWGRLRLEGWGVSIRIRRLRTPRIGRFGDVQVGWILVRALTRGLADGLGSVRRQCIRSASVRCAPAIGRLDDVIDKIIPVVGLVGSRTDGDVLVAGELNSIRVRRWALRNRDGGRAVNATGTGRPRPHLRARLDWVPR